MDGRGARAEVRSGVWAEVRCRVWAEVRSGAGVEEGGGGAGDGSGARVTRSGGRSEGRCRGALGWLWWVQGVVVDGLVWVVPADLRSDLLGDGWVQGVVVDQLVWVVPAGPCGGLLGGGWGVGVSPTGFDGLARAPGRAAEETAGAAGRSGDRPEPGFGYGALCRWVGGSHASEDTVPAMVAISPNGVLGMVVRSAGAPVDNEAPQVGGGWIPWDGCGRSQDVGPLGVGPLTWRC
ncbi:hypothetical protein SAMN05444920_101351 [Nonomuraea solani]|uniref:Uncharacterized protein n=1 Tax=Nonomuraea solani TaxID=1144553 RepID=A0A1H5U0K7_9ACTN|nr:hypothetical protein SAMN05444920_101351 [Nonomuraea solani]